VSANKDLAELRRTRVLKLAAGGDLTQATIAERLGVTRGCVAKIIANEKARLEAEEARG
jgi:DNA-binding transcriptional regulator LsrR (DeoR family)